MSWNKYEVCVSNEYVDQPANAVFVDTETLKPIIEHMANACRVTGIDEATKFYVNVTWDWDAEDAFAHEWVGPHLTVSADHWMLYWSHRHSDDEVRIDEACYVP
jgi:hypothetical protein